MTTHVRIDVFSQDGILLLGETHSIKYSPVGLLGVPERLRATASSMLCFPTKEEVGDQTNRGDPFTAICDIFIPGAGSEIMSTLLNTGYTVSESGVAQLWIRVDGVPTATAPPSVDGQTGFPPDEHTSQGSREHLPADVKARMKMLCNDICPRTEEGVMLSDRAPPGSRRPTWCIAEIMNILTAEFDASKLKGVREKAMKYMSKSSLHFKRLLHTSVEAWERMGEAERLKKKALLREFESFAEQWRLGPYGFYWDGGKLKRQPTRQELEAFHERRVQNVSKATHPKQ